MKKKKDFTKFTKRNTHKRRSKEAARRELMNAVEAVNVQASGVKIRDSVDIGYSGLDRHGGGFSATGIYVGTKYGYGFLSVEGCDRDIFIPSGNSRGAIDSDYVDVVYRRYRDPDGSEKTEGRVVRIIQMGRKTVIGTLSEELRRHGRRYYRVFYIQPDDPRLSLAPYVSDLGGARLGDRVEALLRRDGSDNPECDIIRSFGRDGTKEASYEAILAECGITVEFSPEELAFAESCAAEPVSPNGREDLRNDMIFTIDGEGAKDLDDAVSLRRLPGGGWRLGVHIADVSHYVKGKTPLDRCVMARGTSVYFTDKVVPMLPPALSNGACSLNAGEDKYTISAFIDLDKDGEIVGLRLAPAIIRSRVRGVYSEVNSILSCKADAEIKKKYRQVIPTLEKMRELYELLLKKSRERGAVDFDADEAVILLNDSGMPIAVERRERGVAERIIEQFMLTANEAVAILLTERGIPCVYRIHEPPSADSFSDFLSYLESLGFDVKRFRKSEPTSHDLIRLLDIAEKKGLLEPVSYTMLRSMSKAKYSEVRTAHFGLSIESYCHFTSPIRRLSDLATHRIIRRVLFDGKRAELYSSYARRAAAAATEGELRALSAERRIEDLYKVLFMQSRVGESFDATVTSITSFGMFCTLENTCEGLVPISELDGVFTFDERNLTLRSSRKTYHIADRVRVRLEEANITRGKLRFSVVSE